MSPLEVTRRIEAPVDLVFRTVSDPGEFANVSDDVVRIEFVSDTRKGVGTVFRETRSMNGKENTVELELTEYVENEQVRFVADSHGTIWDSNYTLSAEGSGTLLTLKMSSRPYKMAAKLMNPLVKGIVQKALEKDMDAVKKRCESTSTSDG